MPPVLKIFKAYRATKYLDLTGTASVQVASEVDFSTSSKLLAGYGNDEIVLESMANLPSRKGWFDVVVHGAKN
ncbi:hypothetical protein BW716_27555 [[Flexibacter] sp. ATCC 35208]|nr:hypothetical protein BW716_27555 [[Flexibacter] sp. ATCC 35208]